MKMEKVYYNDLSLCVCVCAREKEIILFKESLHITQPT